MSTVEAREQWGHGRKTMEFWVVRGEVVSVMNESHRTVESTGGGGWIGPYGGHVSAPTIYTRTRHSGSFWLRGVEGQEFQIHTGTFHLPLRTGHQVSALCCGLSPRPLDNILTSVVVNHTTGQALTVHSAHQLIDLLKITWRPGWLFVITTTASLLALSAPKAWLMALVKALVIIAVVALFNDLRVNLMGRSLTRHIDRLIKTLHR